MFVISVSRSVDIFVAFFEVVIQSLKKRELELFLNLIINNHINGFKYFSVKITPFAIVTIEKCYKNSKIICQKMCSNRTLSTIITLSIHIDIYPIPIIKISATRLQRA